MKSYEDMLYLDRPASRHPKMQRQDRAKLFAPFAALNGHSEAIHAREKMLMPKIKKTPWAQSVLDSALRQIKKGDTVTVTWFVPLQQTENEILGEYRTAVGTVERLDLYHRELHLTGQRINIDDLEELRRENCQLYEME